MTGTQALAQKAPAPPAAAPADDTPPLLRVEAGGPTSQVTALAFGPDSKTLYAAGFDKVIRVWNLDPQSGKFVLDPFAYRVPIGPGNVGALNVLAVSPDGKWLAVSGLGVSRTGAKAQEAGRVYPYIPPRESERRTQQWTIYLFNTGDHTLKQLSGHVGKVLCLAFAPAHPNKPTLLVSAAKEPSDQGDRTIGRVCLWDVDKTALVDEEILVETPKQEMGLAVRHTGKQLKQLHVAVAWSDGYVRIWNPAQKGPARVKTAPDGLAKWNSTAAYLAGSTLFTGGVTAERGGYLQAWNDLPGAAPKRTAKATLHPLEGFQFAFPRAVDLFPSRAGRQPTHAAVAVRLQAVDPVETRVGLVLVESDSLAQVAQVGLWRGRGDPTLAASPDGRYLAVAEDPEHAIWLYTVADLLRNQAKPRQRLVSAGVTLRSVAFVQKDKGQDLGLFLSGRAGAKRGDRVRMAADDLVFDFAKRSLTRDPQKQNWSVTNPALDGWRVTQAPKALDLPKAGGNVRWQLAWEGPNASKQVTLTLPTSEEITDIVLLPPSQFTAPVPLVALATWDDPNGKALIRLHLAETGEEVREYQGHTQRISALAASRDGRLLASVADDQTVCIWTLTDLNTILGQHGTLWGVFIQKEGNKLVVKRVDEGSTAQGKLAEGDRLKSLTTKDGAKKGAKPRPFVVSPLDYYNALWDVKPKTEVQLQIERQGKEETVTVTVGQGVDDQRPLLSLFITGDDPQAPEWLAWTPIGPYDASGKEVERHLGWHFNPSKLEEPARFAGADAYREKFYRPALLKPLLAHADIHKALGEIDKPQPLPKPDLHMEIDVRGATPPREDGQGQILVRDPETTLHVTVSGPSLGENQVEAVTWRLDGGAPQPFDLQKASGQRLTESVRLPSKPGIHTLQVQLHTKEANPQEATRTLTVRYQPPAPEIQFDEQWLREHFRNSSDLRKVVEEKKFTIKARIRPHQPGQAVKVSVQKNQDAPVPLGVEIEHLINGLRFGENVIQIQAENQDPLPGYESFERDRRTLFLIFNKKGTQIILKTVEPLIPLAVPAAIKPGESLAVSHPEVRVVGTIQAAEDLEQVEIQNAKGTVLAKAEPKNRVFPLSQELSLKPVKPGEQREFRFVAQTVNGETAEARLTLVYHPPLPELELTDPLDDLSLTKGKDEPAIAVKGRFKFTGQAEPFAVVIQVMNGEETVVQDRSQQEIVRFFPTVPEGESQLLATVRLKPGSNRIQVRVRNDWATSPPSERHVMFRRPPSLVALRGSLRDAKKPFVDIVATVESPSDLPLTRIEINGVEYTQFDARSVKQAQGLTTWEVRVDEVPLPRENNTLRLLVSNKDGRCLEDKAVTVPFMAEVEKVARVQIAKPRDGVLDSEYRLQFHVVSESKLKMVEVRRGNQVLQSFAGAKEQDQDVMGFYILKKVVVVHLEPGTEKNHFEIVAVNAGGAASDRVVVGYVRPAVHLAIQPPDAVVQGPKLTLTGSVTFRDLRKAVLNEKKARRIQVYVNGFLQPPAVLQLGKALSTQAPFTAELVLNRRENKIEIECPDLPLEAGRRQEFMVTCLSPQPPGTLHLLVVGVDVKGKKEQDQLEIQAFRALQTNPGTHGLRSEVFSRVVIHPYTEDRNGPVLAGYVTQGQVNSALAKMQSFLEKKGSPSDVVLIYWLGRDLVKEGQEWYLPTSESRPREKITQTGIPLKKLLGMDDNSRGARVLLLDGSTAPPSSAVAPLDLPVTHAAVLRYAWSRVESPFPGLLRALEEASTAQKRITLQDIADAADQLRRRDYPESLQLTHNLQRLSSLASLVMIQKP
jgi:WD40 repeat protein